MKKLVFLFIILFSACIISLCFSSATSDKKHHLFAKTNIRVNNQITVLELFTSQGCSSCPPADRLVGKYTNAENVIALSFHVDYWNRLGWTDPFSSEAFSQRQKEYARAFKLEGVYTPQLVINGEKEIVGSDEGKLNTILKAAGNKVSNQNIRINSIDIEGGKAVIRYTVRGGNDRSLLNLALVQREVVTSIKAGENNGINLTNFNVVRNFKTVDSLAGGTNSVSLDMPPGIAKKDLDIIAFLQNPATHKISAAAKSAL